MRSRRRVVGALVLPLIGAGLLAACGGDDNGDQSTTGGRVIDVTMTDNAFSPTSFSVRRGEAVTFRFRNEGKLVHEAVFGDEAEQQAHESEMSSTTMKDDSSDMDGMDHGGGNDSALKVDPGETGEVTETFDETGTTLIGCHQPGHWAAGMKATVTVN